MNSLSQLAQWESNQCVHSNRNIQAVPAVNMRDIGYRVVLSVIPFNVVGVFVDVFRWYSVIMYAERL
jgi:hypothetical protein